MDQALPNSELPPRGTRPQVFVECVGTTVALDPVGYIDGEVADTLLRIASTLDEVVGLDGHVIRLRRATGVSLAAWNRLSAAGWEPIHLVCTDIVLRRRGDWAAN